jgi:hypothetical protein
LRHSPERSHLQGFDFVGAGGFADQTDLRGHFLGTLGQYGRRHAIGGFVDQIAGEVLRLGDNARRLQSALQRFCVALHDYRETVDLLVVLVILAIALVVAGLKVAYCGAFYDGGHGFRRGNSRAFRQNVFR